MAVYGCEMMVMTMMSAFDDIARRREDEREAEPQLSGHGDGWGNEMENEMSHSH
jgi:hypothetical protein